MPFNWSFYHPDPIEGKRAILITVVKSIPEMVDLKSLLFSLQSLRNEDDHAEHVSVVEDVLARLSRVQAVLGAVALLQFVAPARRQVENFGLGMVEAEDDGDDRDEQKVLQLHFEGWLVNRLKINIWNEKLLTLKMI